MHQIWHYMGLTQLNFIIEQAQGPKNKKKASVRVNMEGKF